MANPIRTTNNLNEAIVSPLCFRCGDEVLPDSSQQPLSRDLPDLGDGFPPMVLCLLFQSQQQVPLLCDECWDLLCTRLVSV